jgi:hypothetical protein
MEEKINNNNEKMIDPKHLEAMYRQEWDSSRL